MQGKVVFLCLMLVSFNVSAGWLDAIKTGAEVMKVVKPKQTEQVVEQVQPVVNAAELVNGENDLAGYLVQNMGITPEQAVGGSMAVLGEARGNMSADQYSQLNSYIPNAQQYQPAETSAVGAVAGNLASGYLASKTGLSSNTIQKTGSVVSQFAKLGMGPEQIPVLVKAMSQYLQAQGGQESASLLLQAAASLL
ncbi:MAG: DUF2780 domain-containing protein [Pseudomonadales bacterium]|nr:DUF2780 domain-containing protein [Pseudomonadales bacterium]